MEVARENSVKVRRRTRRENALPVVENGGDESRGGCGMMDEKHSSIEEPDTIRRICDGYNDNAKKRGTAGAGHWCAPTPTAGNVTVRFLRAAHVRQLDDYLG